MPRGPRKLRGSFGSPSLTHYGGAYLLHRFFSRLRLKKLLTQEMRVVQRNNRYSVGEMLLLALLYPMILGLERIETTQLLRQNGVFQHLTGLPSYPDATTLRRFLLRVVPNALSKVRALRAGHGELRLVDTHTASGTLDLLTACFTKIPAEADR